jgi:aminoglycoside 2''-phosphotransferase
MPQIPPSDRDLDERIALRALQEQLPALACQCVEHIGSGWASDVYLVDNRFVARFPRNAEIAKWVDFDQAVYGLVARSIGSAFSTPKVVTRGRAGAHFPYDFLVCEYVRGIPANSNGAAASDRLPADLGRALTRIHSISISEARNAGLPAPQESSPARPACFLHGDFGPANIIVDPASGRLVGVIDWGNAEIGDPAGEFAYLVLWQGWRFMHAVLSAYELPVDDNFLGRVKGNAQAQAQQWLADSVKRGLDTALHSTWMRNAFSIDA